MKGTKLPFSIVNAGVSHLFLQRRSASFHTSTPRPGFALNWLRHLRRRIYGIILGLDLH